MIKNKRFRLHTYVRMYIVHHTYKKNGKNFFHPHPMPQTSQTNFEFESKFIYYSTRDSKAVMVNFWIERRIEKKQFMKVTLLYFIFCINVTFCFSYFFLLKSIISNSSQKYALTFIFTSLPHYACKTESQQGRFPI